MTTPADNPFDRAIEPDRWRVSLFSALRQDGRRYTKWYSAPGFWVGATYRFGVWARSLALPLRVPMVLLYRIAVLPWRLFLNVTIHASHIGPGLCLIHPQSIIIGGGVIIREHCLIFHEVTLGTGSRPGTPTIGNGVDMYPGARILGGIHVGDNSMIGANVVVTHDVPPCSVVVPAASRTVPRALLRRDLPTMGAGGE